jgi:hypothetical protein
MLVIFDDLVPEPCKQNAYLNCPACNKIVETNGAPRVVLEEDHEESEANKDHDMNILE